MSVLVGWCASVFALLVVAAGVATILASEVSAPVGIYEHVCYDYFAECDTYVCIDIDRSVGNAPYDSLGSQYDWRFCNLNSSVKLQAMACIYDQELYASTDGGLGFDVCSDEFEEGVYVFEDTFDHWTNATNFKSNLMRSAPWDKQVNAYVSNDCGTASGRGALTFGGEFYRFMDTGKLDVLFGGFIEADVFIAPEGIDNDKYPKYVKIKYVDIVFKLVLIPCVRRCKASFQGDVVIEYSIDDGDTWVVLASYASSNFRQNSFFHVKEAIPAAGQTMGTKFRFSQPTFESVRDSWALDNVKVYHFFKKDWKGRSAFKTAIETTHDQIQRAQCCFDTEHCETRLSEAEMKECTDIPWFDSPEYQLRGLELFICFALLASIIKFIYNSTENWLLRRRIPFQEEYDYIIRIDALMKWIPAEYRPNRRRDDTVDEIHQFARDAVKAAEEAANSDILDMDAHLEKVKEEQKKLASLKKKQLSQKSKKKKKKKQEKSAELTLQNVEEGHALDIVPEPSSDIEDTKEESNLEIDQENEDMEHAAILKSIGGPKKYTGLRVPFELENRPEIRMVFATAVVGMLVIFFLYKASTQANYVVVEEVNAYGEIRSEINILSGGVLLFALFLDGKEIYHTLKSVVPLYNSWVPYVTIDSSSDANALYVGPHTISLGDIYEAHAFHQSFAWGCLFGYFMGCFPWCLVLMIIRDQYLAYDVMRIMTPALGSLLLARAILGPAIFCKVFFTLQYGIDFDIKSRESIGISLQTNRTKYSAIHTAFAFAVGGTFFISIFAVDYAAIAFGAFLIVGLAYGTLTGCIHGLPVHPWFIFSTIQDGVWLRLKKKERCPCIYWGRYCTEMHSVQDMFIVFPRDPVTFISRLKGQTT